MNSSYSFNKILISKLARCRIESRRQLKQESQGLRCSKGLIDENIQECIYRQKSEREYKGKLGVAIEFDN